ncbi:class I SAM-dependent methyltransferase [Desulfitobacterium sp. Sab5]|uniref:class I SAM-dependent methyltransferase n=1 Tax=Desulfitobacterium nosdiversum TaxID=3375356 RepID=UPI003CE8CF2B
MLKSDNKMDPSELLQKEMIWQQLSFINNKRVLDFGSGVGITANHFAVDNDVVAIEPSDDMINSRIEDNQYLQIKGSLNALEKIESSSFDIVLCHNVLEYVEERLHIVREFARILKDGGILSVVKHNRYGRVMQMLVLLNNFEHANDLLNGKSGYAQKFGRINYYDDQDIIKWSNVFSINEVHGIRTFWDLQQNQEIHKDIEWQKKMLAIETRVSDIEEFKAIASFHHIILQRTKRG